MTALRNELVVMAGDSIDHWHDVTCRDYSASEYRRETAEPFSASISRRQFGALSLSDVSSSGFGAASLIRSRADIRRDPRDHFMAFLVEEGGVSVLQEGREMTAQAGDLFLYDQARPFTLKFQHSYSGVVIDIPRPMLETRLPSASRLVAHRISGDSKLGGLAGTILRQIMGLDEQLKDVAIDRLGGSALDILATTLDAQASDELSLTSRHHRLLEQVKTYMLAHLHEPGMDLEIIARAQNMAPRTLNRVFATEGTTPIRWLWQQRLTASHRALVEGHVRNVTEAALNYGFSDLSHFSRAFKSAFGKSPRALVPR
jgi:AraC-like DNA-binding protein